MILFSRNIESPDQVARLISDMKSTVGEDLIVGVDQEGGRVMRLKAPFMELPPMATFGAEPDGENVVRHAGEMLGRELASLGFSVDFAPVLDVLTNPKNPVIGDRSFSSDPCVVAKLGCAFIEGLQSQGIAACGKHFPGHGDTDVDSHLGLPVVNHDRARFEECEFVPFRAAVAAGVASMMTAHMLVPRLDPDSPATISERITNGILRRELGFEGVIFTDDLRMKGISDKYPPYEAAWRAIKAGADIAMICRGEADCRSAVERLLEAVNDGIVGESQIMDSMKRIAALKSRFK